MHSSRCRSSAARLLLLVLGLSLLQPSAAFAHEIGTTQVALVLKRDRTWSAAITTAPSVLVNRLERRAGQPPSEDLTPEAVREKLAQLNHALAAGIDVRFDDVASPAAVTVRQVEMPADVTLPAFVVLGAEGKIPAGASAVTWR
jgi:hypothetical protein